MSVNLKKIGFLGPKGTNTEEAAFQYLEMVPEKYELVPFNTVYDVIMAVDKKEIHEGIVPLENSIEGSVTQTLDLLADSDIKLKIKQEIDLPIFNYLLTNQKTRIEDIKEVFSHPHALAQCQHYLREHFQNITTINTASTGAAAELVSIDSEGKAAIASQQIGQDLGLKVLAKNINDYDSVTRFVVVAGKDHEPTGKDKTSLVFSGKKDRPGVLFDLLGELAKREINLTKIESRPRKKVLGDYLFFIDLEGHRKDDKVAEALKEIGQKASLFKILGSYPVSQK